MKTYLRRLIAALAVTALGFTAGATYSLTHQPSTRVGHAYPAAWVQTYQDCAEGSAAAIIGSLTGHTPSEADITAVALTITDSWSTQRGYDPNGGTQMWALVPLFAHYDLVASLQYDPTLAQLETWLKRGYRAQVIVDAQALWRDSGADPKATPSGTPNHAVAVTTIDPVKDAVTIADSAYGRVETVTLSQFASMWAPSHNATVLVK